MPESADVISTTKKVEDRGKVLQLTIALAPSYVSSDANSRESKRNLVPLVGADANFLGQECSGV